MDASSLLLDGLELAVQAALHLRFAGRLTGTRPAPGHAALYLALLCALQGASAVLGWPGLLAVGAQAAILYGVVRLALGVRPAGAWTAAVLAVYVSQLSFGLTASAQTALSLPPVGLPVSLLTTAAAAAVCAGCFLPILKLSPLAREQAAPHVGLLLFPGLSSCSVQLYILDTAYSVAVLPPAPAQPGRQLALLALQALGLGALLCTLYAYRRVCQSFRDQAALASLAQAARAQQRYAAEAQLRYERTRAFRHDLNGHLSVLAGLLRRGQTVQAERYLRDMEAASASLSLPCRTGDPVVDVLLGEKWEVARACGIEMEASPALPSGGGPGSFDLCVIFANALDNAITACRAVEGPRSIRIGGTRQGGFWLLTFENSCLPGPLPPEGTGLANIRAAAEKYRGTVLTEKDGAVFRLNVLLDLSGPGSP